MRLADSGLALALVWLLATPAEAAETLRFGIAAGRLGPALAALGAQARITIGVSDPRVAGLRTSGVRGRMSVDDAIARLLGGTGYTYQRISPDAVRIVLAPDRPPPRQPEPSPTPTPSPEAVEIVVTASKQNLPLDRFPGTVQIVRLAPSETSSIGSRGSDYIYSLLPMLSSTSLGTGRNKLYIRGVADSSFNGPSQSVIGQYLGDARLTFNAPDPDLRLYDIERVEVLEGPQGTLYGTGSLGGILRLVPAPPDTAGVSGTVSAGLTTTAHGAVGGDAAAMVNLPIISERAALRMVGYSVEDPGYIDDAARNLEDINRTRVHGGRATLLVEPGDDWSVELAGVAQFITGRDGQYATRDQAPLTRRSAIGQPFDNDFQLGNLTIRKRWGAVELVSATSAVKHVLESTYDASGFPETTGIQSFVEDVDLTLFAHETRLSRQNRSGAGWVAGLSLLRSTNRTERDLGPPGAEQPITGVRNVTSEAALFGQYSIAVTHRLVATAGGRLTFSTSEGMPLDLSEDDDIDVPDRSDRQFSPTATLSWQPISNLSVFTRYQEGFRAGGLAVAGDPMAPSVTRFDSDRLQSIEAGFRWGNTGERGLSVAASISHTLWDDIQADLIDERGLPYTTNIGDGRIYGLEIDASWRPSDRFVLSAAGFLNSSSLYEPGPAFAEADERDLPNVAKAGGRLAARYEDRVGPDLPFGLHGSLRYVGTSQLGIGAPLDLSQGGYIDAELGARFDLKHFGLTLDVTNIGDVRSNRFSFGNPFSVADGLQITPLRPRTVRIGIDAAF